MKQRIVTAIIALAALGIVLFVVPDIMARVIIGLLILAGAWEWSGFLGRSGFVARLSYVAMIGVILVSIPLFFAEYARQILLNGLVWWL